MIDQNQKSGGSYVNIQSGRNTNLEISYVEARDIAIAQKCLRQSNEL